MSAASSAGLLGSVSRTPWGSRRRRRSRTSNTTPEPGADPHASIALGYVHGWGGNRSGVHRAKTAILPAGGGWGRGAEAVGGRRGWGGGVRKNWFGGGPKIKKKIVGLCWLPPLLCNVGGGRSGDGKCQAP